MKAVHAIHAIVNDYLFFSHCNKMKELPNLILFQGYAVEYTRSDSLTPGRWCTDKSSRSRWQLPVVTCCGVGDMGGGMVLGGKKGMEKDMLCYGTRFGNYRTWLCVKACHQLGGHCDFGYLLP